MHRATLDIWCLHVRIFTPDLDCLREMLPMRSDPVWPARLLWPLMLPRPMPTAAGDSHVDSDTSTACWSPESLPRWVGTHGLGNLLPCGPCSAMVLSMLVTIQ